MIDPSNITKFDRTNWELEEFAIFAILVAGKTAKVVAPRLEKLLTHPIKNVQYSPLYWLGFSLGKDHDGNYLAEMLRDHGFGCYNQKAETIMQLYDYVSGGCIDLRTCSPLHLECVRGIGPKTSRFFILHSRPNARVAALDTHILKGLRHYLPENIVVPKATPQSNKAYQRLENHFLHLSDMFGQSPAELDLHWWKKYSGG